LSQQDGPPGDRQPTGGTDNQEAVFQLTAGCVEFDGVHVLHHLDLSIMAGSFTALLGANGSGKSTLVRVLLGLQPLAHGHLRVYGQPLASFRDWSRLAFVPQRLPVASGVPVSVREMVASSRIGPRTRWHHRSRSEAKACADALELVGLYERRLDRFDTLSGGQQRRVMVARALAGGAEVLVLDEPTAGVDLVNQKGLADVLGLLTDKTVILVAHGLGPMAPLVTRTIVLANGAVAYDGATAPPGWIDVHHHSDGTPPAPTILEG
jgi:zinc transport system ATP-binding protein